MRNGHEEARALLTVGQLVEPLTGRRWDAPAVTREVSVRAARYRRGGLRPGDRVLLHFGNRLEFFAELLAIRRLGGVAVPVDGTLTRVELERLNTFRLTLDLAGLRPWLEARSFYCLLLSLGVYVSMQREQPRRGAAAAATPAPMPTRIRRIAGVWTFFALISIWADASSATFGQRVEFFVSLFGLR